MMAAVSGYYVPGSGEAGCSWGANFYTLLDALCFFHRQLPDDPGAGRVVREGFNQDMAGMLFDAIHKAVVWFEGMPEHKPKAPAPQFKH
jgi:hypothetical protein